MERERTPRASGLPLIGWGSAAERAHGVDDSGEHTTLSRVLLLRYAYVVALAVGVMVIPGLGATTAVAVLVLGFATNAAARAHAKRAGRIPGWVHVADVVACLSFPLVIPRMAAAAAVVMLAAVALAAMASGRRWAMVCSLVGAAGLGSIHAFIGIEDGLLLIIPVASASLMVSLSVGLLATNERRLRSQLRRVVEDLGAVVWAWDLEGRRYTFVSHRAETLLGWPLAQWSVARFWIDRVHPDDRGEVTRVRRAALRDGSDYDLRYRFSTADGRWLHVNDRVAVSCDGGGRPRWLQGTMLDVTERHEAEERVLRYAAIVDNIDLALVVLAVDDEAPERPIRLLAANPAASILVQRDLGSLLGATVEEAFPALADTPLRARLDEVLRTNRVTHLGIAPGTPGAETSRLVSLQAFPLAGQGIGVAIHDITDAHAAAEALRHQANHDGLTGLPNRRYLDETLQDQIGRAARAGTPLALLVMDLDQFKEVNDALGHHVGDRLLTEIGTRLQAGAGDSVVARLGGDEFAVVLAGAGRAEAEVTAARLRKVVTEPFTIDGLRLQANVSVGISLFPDHGDETITLIQRADVAMYLAKRAGRGLAVYDAGHDRSSVERLTLIGDLQGAVDENQLELHFQPYLDLRTGRLARAEALVRWRHPRLGLLAPDRFIELAELSGVIQPLTRWVLTESLAAAARWRAAGHDLGLSVNLSFRNLYDPGLVDHVAHELAASGVPAGQLTLELTESELVDDPGLARRVFVTLGELGVGMSIDDFGTGYSSLTFLRDLPVREIKIDRSFVAGISRRGDEFTIVRSMIELGHNLGLEVVAEGVEDSDSLTLLENLGCELIQGFHVSRPLPMALLVPWLDGVAARERAHAVAGGGAPG